MIFQYFKCLFSFLSAFLKIHVSFLDVEILEYVFFYVIKRQLLGLATNGAK